MSKTFATFQNRAGLNIWTPNKNQYSLWEGRKSSETLGDHLPSPKTLGKGWILQSNTKNILKNPEKFKLDRFWIPENHRVIRPKEIEKKGAGNLQKKMKQRRSKGKKIRGWLIERISKESTPPHVLLWMLFFLFLLDLFILSRFHTWGEKKKQRGIRTRTEKWKGEEERREETVLLLLVEDEEMISKNYEIGKMKICEERLKRSSNLQFRK